MSEGVTGSDGGGGRLINVGALDIATICGVFKLGRKVPGVARSSLPAARASEGAVDEDVSSCSRRGVMREKYWNGDGVESDSGDVDWRWFWVLWKSD